MGGSGPLYKIQGSTRFHNPNGILIGSAIFVGLTVVADRPTDRPRYSICNNELHLASAVIWSKNTE